MESIYYEIETLASHKDDWNLLASSLNNPMLYFDWFRYCIKYFHENDELFIFCLTENDKLIAAAPLYRCSENGKLKVIGNDALYEPTSFLFRDDVALNRLIQFILNAKMPVELNRLPLKYEEYVKRMKYIFMRTITTKGSQYINNIGNYENFMTTLNSGRRSDLRRSLRKLASMGDYSFDIYKPTHLEISYLLQMAFEVEKKCWKGDIKSAILDNESFIGFISNIFTHFSNGNSIIGILHSNRKAIACNLSIRVNNTLWILKIGYDVNYKQCSPGILLTHNMIKYCCDNNIENIEFLGSTEDWINLWRPNERKYMTLLYYPVSYCSIKTLIKDMVSVLKMKTQMYSNNE